MASHKCEKRVQTYWPISLDKEKNKLDSYLRANACISLPGCELSEDMSLSSKTIKRNTDYTNPPEIHADLSRIPYRMFQIKHWTVKTFLFRFANPITYLGAYPDTIDLSEEKKKSPSWQVRKNHSTKQTAFGFLDECHVYSGLCKTLSDWYGRN